MVAVVGKNQLLGIKTFSVPTDKLNAQNFLYYSESFPQLSACVAVHLPFLCKKYVLKHFCDLFVIKHTLFFILEYFICSTAQNFNQDLANLSENLGEILDEFLATEIIAVEISPRGESKRAKTRQESQKD